MIAQLESLLHTSAHMDTSTHMHASLFPGSQLLFLLLVLSIFSIGVYDALQKKYLKTLMFCICESKEGPMIEEYACKSLSNYCFEIALSTNSLHNTILSIA